MKNKIILPERSTRDFPEDFHEENGCYQNRCIKCEQLFFGHKYRRICNECLNNKNDDLIKYLSVIGN